MKLRQGKENGPQLGDDHGDQGGVSPAPAVDRVRKAVGEVAEGRNEQEDRIQQELQAQFDKALCAEKKKDAQKGSPRIAEGAVFNFIAGKKIQWQHAAGFRVVKQIDGRIEGDPLISQNGNSHREQDRAAHGDADSAGGEHDADLSKAAAYFALRDREIAEQSVQDCHKNNAHDKVEIAYGRQKYRENEEPGLPAVAHLFNPQKQHREDDQRVKEDRLSEAGDQGKAAEGIDQCTCQAASVIFPGRPAEAAERGHGNA